MNPGKQELAKKPDITTSGTTTSITETTSMIAETFTSISKPTSEEWAIHTATTIVPPEQLNHIMRETDARITERLEEYNKSLPNRITPIVVSLINTYFKNETLTSIVMRDPELEWIASHPQELAKYQGRYLAILDGKIVGSGKTLSEARKAAKENAPDTEPLIMGLSDNDFGL